jgi:hypothetical protein
MRSLVLAIAIAGLTAACGGYQFPGGGSSSQTGHVNGQVLVFPCAPVEQQGQTCKGLPGRAIAITFVNGSDTVTATTDDSGDYATDLAAGTWKVTFKGIMRIISGPNPITVPAGGSITADYVVDSGIRAPGPPAAAP